MVGRYTDTQYNTHTAEDLKYLQGIALFTFPTLHTVLPLLIKKIFTNTILAFTNKNWLNQPLNLTIFVELSQIPAQLY